MLTLNDEMPSTNTATNSKIDQNVVDLKYNDEKAAEQRRQESVTPIPIDDFNVPHIDDHFG